jgi:hypothetical protein
MTPRDWVILAEIVVVLCIFSMALGINIGRRAERHVIERDGPEDKRGE